MRSRVVQVDTQKITAARRGREVLKLNLFDDAVVEVQIKRVRPTRNGYFISGTPKGMEWGEVRLVVNGPVMVGTVVTPDGKFTIRSAASNRHIIRQIDPAKEIFECEAEDSPLPSPASLPAISSIGPPPSLATRPAIATDSPTEDGSEIRVLVVFTRAMQAEQGGPAGMRALIDLMIQYTNQAFEDSGINPRLVLAHAAMVDYIREYGQIDLPRLRSPDDGYLDEVHALRNRHAADLVHMITTYGGGGLAYVTLSESLSNENSAAFAYTASGRERVFAHETGHNLGLAHDRYVLGRGLFPYSNGYVNKRAFDPGAPSTAGWKTIMSYPRRCIDAGIQCLDINRFSNPDQTFRGDPLGIPADSPVIGPDGPADARLTINNSARWVGSFRSQACTDFRVSPQAPVAPVGGGEVVVRVTTSPGCLWEASSQTEFLEISAGALWAGPGFVKLDVKANRTGARRNATVTVAGKTLTLRQPATDEGICGRTSAVADVLAKAAGFSGIAQCEQVTEEDLATVEFLDLGDQGIEFLKSGDFEGLSELKTLKLASNRLTQLPEGIFRGLSSLNALKLSGNRLAQLPGGLLDGLSELNALSLYGNKLVELPPGLLNQQFKLEVLNLDDNQLTVLREKAFAGLSKLSSLHLASNRLTALPDGLFNGLSGLKFLKLGRNYLAVLPEGLFAGLSKLQSLALSSNRLTDVSHFLHADLAGLKTLRIDGNRLRLLSEDVFSGLANLEWLNIRSNRLIKLPQRVFSGLARLEVLLLDDNLLQEIPLGLFDGLPLLRRLDLTLNGLISLRTESFRGLIALKVLDLSYNKLNALPVGLFSALPTLETLYLQNNQFRSIPEGVFAGLGNLTRLDLQLNPGFPLPLHVSLEEVQENQFKAVSRAGAPFPLSLPVSVSSAGSIAGDIGVIAIPAGATESSPVTVSRVEGTNEAVSVDLGTLPELPPNHTGYELKRDESLPLRILPSLLSTDATLTDLALNEGALEPAFDADTNNYSVLVDNEVSTITVTATTSNAEARVGFFDETSVSLQDTDGASDGHQLSLSVGENTINLRVASEDGSAMQTYTLAVTRDNAANVCSRTSQVRDAIVEVVQHVDDCFDVTEANLAEITDLNLFRSGISALQSGDFAGLKNLKIINLGVNSLSRLPADIFAGLEALEQLRLFINSLSVLPADVFSGLVALKHLDLSSNRFNNLPERVFADLTSLEQLFLDFNVLVDLPADQFAGLSVLRTLSLSGNPFGNLPAGIFSDLAALQELNLSGNQIEDLPAPVFSRLAALKTLVIPHSDSDGYKP